MGYTTEFEGQFIVTPTLTPAHAEYLRKFNETRRMARDPAQAAQLDDPLRLAVGLPIGQEGGYFVGAGGSYGQSKDASIVDYNGAPRNQPGLWCNWTTNDDGTAIVWDHGEKFYSYVQWLEYLIEHFLKPWGYVLDGKVSWQGEEASDIGLIWCQANEVVAITSNTGALPKLLK